ncbi:hypothetical protein GE21DRAFT_1095751 [Neurospora crassa]|nr:hypothetical protein GE21DRAFT_1095751 [Neurospora crassa]
MLVLSTSPTLTPCLHGTCVSHATFSISFLLINFLITLFFDSRLLVEPPYLYDCLSIYFSLFSFVYVLATWRAVSSTKQGSTPYDRHMRC